MALAVSKGKLKGLVCILSTAGLAATLVTPVQARVTRIVIDEQKPLANASGQTIEYEQLSGRAFGELDPRDPLNALIQDIELGKDKDGKVRYTATFVLTDCSGMTCPIAGAASRSRWQNATRATSAWQAPSRATTRAIPWCATT